MKAFYCFIAFWSSYLAARTPIPNKRAICDTDNSLVALPQANFINSTASSSSSAIMRPGPRAYHAATAVASTADSKSHYMAISGGCAYKYNNTGTFASTKPITGLADTWLFDFSAHVWYEVITSFAPPARFAHTISPTCDNQSIILFGGASALDSVDRNKPDPCLGSIVDEGRSLLSDFWLLSASQNGSRSWIRLNLPGSPSARAGHTMTSSSRGLVMFGGMTDNGPTNEVWLLSCVDAKNFVWTQPQPASSPPSRFGHSASLITLTNFNKNNGSREYVLIFGGTTDGDLTVFDDLWAFDTQDFIWIPVDHLSPSPTRRFHHTSVSDKDGVLVVHGGTFGTGRHLRDAWQWDVETGWSQIYPWFYPSDIDPNHIEYATDDMLYRDQWAHTAVATPKSISLSTSVVMFGGFWTLEYVKAPINYLLEYSFYSASNQKVMQWRESPVFGPFARQDAAVAALVEKGEALSEISQDQNCKCLDESFTWLNRIYLGCARPLGFPQFICQVDSKCSMYSVWEGADKPPQLQSPSKMFWKVCSDTRLALYGGIYSGDSDHSSFTEEPGVVWTYSLSQGIWHADEFIVNDHVPPALSEHSLVSFPALDQAASSSTSFPSFSMSDPEWLTSTKAPPQLLHKDFKAGFTQEATYLLLYGGFAHMKDGSKVQNCNVYQYAPAYKGTLGLWSLVYDCEKHLNEAAAYSLRRSGHASCIVEYKSDLLMVVSGGYIMTNWANRQPVEPAMVYFNLTSRSWSTFDFDTIGDYLTPRFHHSMSLIPVPNPLLVIFGGANGDEENRVQLLNDVHIFDLTTKQHYSLKDSTIPPRSRHSSAAFGNKIVIFGGQAVAVPEITCAQLDVDCAEGDLWQLDLSLISSSQRTADWHLMHNYSDSLALRQAASAFADNSLIMFGGLVGSAGRPSDQVKVIRPGCNIGHFSRDFWHVSCNPCEKGSYSPTMGSFCCSPCPADISSTSIGSTSPSDCTVCVDDYCHGHGSCNLTLTKSQSQLRPSCTCDATYLTSDNCKQPWLIILPACVVAAVLIVILVAWWTRKYLRSRARRKLRNLQYQREIEQLHQGWKISVDELEFEERIDRHVSGSMGTVRKATWNGMTVAVKKLHEALMELDAVTSLGEFEQEIRFLRSCRHPNIVLFFGAGDENGVPFLVTEFMSMGSLQQVLADKSISIDTPLRVRFALDAAKGMSFLHSCNPPRIHRDLKTGNLLVNDKWTVKVADFGTSKLMEIATEDLEDSKKKWFRRSISRKSSGSALRSTSSMRDSSQSDYAQTTGIGTPLYQAPELIQCQNYTIKIDVYSFGIVMWEIYHRRLPWQDVSKSVHELRKRVVGGVRPSFDSSCPVEWEKLTTYCWAQSPSQRPDFDAVVEALTKLSNDPLFGVQQKPVSIYETAGMNKRKMRRVRKSERDRRGRQLASLSSTLSDSDPSRNQGLMSLLEASSEAAPQAIPRRRKDKLQSLPNSYAVTIHDDDENLKNDYNDLRPFSDGSEFESDYDEDDEKRPLIINE